MLEREMQIQQSTRATHEFDINKSNEAPMQISTEQVLMNTFVLAGLSNHNEAVAAANQFLAQCGGFDIEHEAFEYRIDPAKVSFSNALAPDTIPNLDASAGIPNVFANNWPG